MTVTAQQNVRLGLAAVLGLISAAASGRPVRFWALEDLGRETYALATAEVRSVRKVKAIDRNETRWRIDLFEMQATLRVLRVFPQETTPGLRPGQILSLRYSAIDRQKTMALVNGPDFPDLHAGDVFVFPLSVRMGGKDAPWELIHEEDHNLLVPAAHEALKDAPTGTGAEFLVAELTGAFAKGRYRDIFTGAKYLDPALRAETLAAVGQLIERQVGNDERRWLDIATACYCAMGVPRPKVAELRKPPAKLRPQAALAAKALGHVRRPGLDERFIANAIRHADLHTWGTAVTIKENYPRHPTAVTLLTRALDGDAPEAIQIAGFVVRAADHPLAGRAVAAATRLLQRPKRFGFGDWRALGHLRAACELVRDYGTNNQFALLLDELRKAQKTDLTRYTMLWQSCAYANNPRVLAICRILIDDRTALPFGGGWRFCDAAAMEAERLSGQRSGLKRKQPIAERDRIIARVRAWLERNRP